jgi:hypothetical protein
MAEISYITEEGLEKLREELEEVKGRTGTTHLR